MKYKKINPFGDDLISLYCDDFLKIAQLIVIQCRPASNCRIQNLMYYAIEQDDFRS